MGVMMKRWCCLLLFSVLLVQISAFPRVKRQASELDESDNLTPLNEDESLEDPNDRDKRMLEGATQAKYGVKNAILGFVFGKINQLIDSKTRFIDQLDKQNIAKNKMYGIEPPGSGAGGLGNVFSSFISPKINLLSGVIGGLSGGSSGSGGGSGSGLGSLLSIFTGLSGSSSGGGGGGGSLTISDSDTSNSAEDEDEDDKE